MSTRREIGFLKINMANKVCTHAFESSTPVGTIHTFNVPDTLFVSGEVYLICRNTAMLIKKPNMPVSSTPIQLEKLYSSGDSRNWLISPEMNSKGNIRTIDRLVLYINNFLAMFKILIYVLLPLVTIHCHHDPLDEYAVQ